VESEPRSTAPTHATGAVEFVSIDDIADDATFRLRDPGDVSQLAASIARLGQLAPVELRPVTGPETRPAEPGPAAEPEDVFRPETAHTPRWQVVSGFRRMAALRMLHRDRVLARLHAGLSDEDAWALCVSKALLSEPWLPSELEALRSRIREVAPWAEELLDEALARASEEAAAPLGPGEEPEPPAEGASADGPVAEPETETVELTPEELALHLAVRIFELNQELAAGWEAWAELPEEGRRQIVEQARYLAELFPLMERETG